MRATILVLFSVTFALAVADINSIRDEGIKRVNALVNNIKKLADDTSIEVGEREQNIKIIGKHEREFGEAVFENGVFQIKKTATSAYMMAKLIGSSNEVFRCIESREREAIDAIQKYFSQKFMTPGRDYETRAEEHQRNVIKTWKDDYYTASRQYGDIHKKAVSDIQRANSQANIAAIVRNFEDTTKQMAEIVTSVHPRMAKIHIEILKNMDQLVRSLQQYARYIVEEATKAIQSCFPRSHQSEDEFTGHVF